MKKIFENKTGYPCRRCGAKIPAGRVVNLCDKCMKEVRR